MFMLSYDTDRKKRMKANNTQNIDYIFNFSWWWLATLNLNIDYIFLMVLIIATMHLFDTKFLYFNSGTCILVHFHLVVPPGVNLTLVCKNSLRICEKKKFILKK